MKSKEGTGLHLLLLVKEKAAPDDAEELTGQYIIGDGAIIDVGVQGGVIAGILSLMMAYYCFDINYPKPMFNCMAILQETVFKEAVVNKKAMSTKAKLFLNKVNRKILEVGDVSV